jgi:hypothetical protein
MSQRVGKQSTAATRSESRTAANSRSTALLTASLTLLVSLSAPADDATRAAETFVDPEPLLAYAIVTPLSALPRVSMSIPDEVMTAPQELPEILPDEQSNITNTVQPQTLRMEISLSSDTFSFSENRHIGSFLKRSGRESRFGSESFVLLRKKLPSRYAYESSAKVNTGYGRYFPDDAIGRSRTSGVGVEDPDWLYVKMSFRF